jgi:3-oxoacyl-[acyl-carrier-protein] synthase II
VTWAVTGLGMVTSLGEDTDSSFAAFCRGDTGRHPLRAFDPTRYRVRNAYERDDRAGGVDVPGRATRWLCAAVRQALSQAGLDTPQRRGRLRIPVVVGTGLAEQRSVELWATGRAAVALDELHFARAVAAATGLPHTVTIVNACAASLYALATGTDLLRLDDADAVVVAGTDAISESMFGLLDRVNAKPPTEVRPFDVDRQGVVLGEGAAAVVVEPVHRARSRGATMLAAVRGVGTSCDAYHLTAPHPGGVARAFRDAHDRAGVKPADIDLVLAHGTGTLLNDETEAQVLREVFGGHRPLVTALKSLIGHTSGGSGLMSLVTAVRSLRTGQVPPTRGHTTPIPQISDFPVVTGQALRAPVGTAQVNAFGFGGVNAVTVLDREVPADPDPTPAYGCEVAVTGVGLQIPGVASIDELLARVDAGAALTPGPFDPAAVLGRRGLRYKDRATLLALCAAARALTAAGLYEPSAGGCIPVQGPVRDGFGVVVSTELALVETVGRVVGTIHAGGVTQTSPMDLPNASGNVASAQVAIWFRLGGLNLTLSAGPTSGIDALYHAAAAIRAGRADRMLVVGVEPADGAAVRLLRDTARRHGEPDPVPFEGAAAVVLEALDAARDRAAATLAQLDSYVRTPALDPAAVPPDWLWAPPCAGHPAGPASPPAGALSTAIGEASGAYGVVQCVAAVARLAGTHRRALISAGGCWGADYASLGLRGTPR